MQTTMSRTTPSGETITTTEQARMHFIGRSSGHNNGGSWVFGPVLVDVVLSCHVSDTRAIIDDTYSVEIDGRHQYGGPTRHLNLDDLPKFLDVVQLVDESDDSTLDEGEGVCSEHVATALLLLVSDVECAHDPFVVDNDATVESVRTFADVGLLTRDDGIVVRLSDGSEFQVTVVQSKQAR